MPLTDFFTRRNVIISTLVASCATSLVNAPAAWAQMSKTKLESLHSSVLSPPHAWNATKDFSSTTGAAAVHAQTFSGYATAPTGTSDDPKNLVYLKYTAPFNSWIRVMPSFQQTIAAAGPGTGDNCHHSHLEWAVYRFGIRQVFNGSTFIPVPVTTLFSSTGALGKRMLNGQQVNDSTVGATCSVTPVADQVYPQMNVFNWGPQSTDVYLGGVGLASYGMALVVLQGVGHGWGGCGTFSCFLKVGVASIRIQ